jgi:hypothetical protein
LMARKESRAAPSTLALMSYRAPRFDKRSYGIGKIGNK